MMTLTLENRHFGVMLDSLWTRYYHCEKQMNSTSDSYSRKYWKDEMASVERTINVVMKATHEA